MNQQELSPIWRHLQDNMDTYFGRTTVKALDRIEYKSRITALLAAPSNKRQNEPQQQGR